MYVSFQDSRCDRIIFAGMVLLSVMVPLTERLTPVWSGTVFELGVFLMLALWAAHRLFFSGKDAVGWVRTPVNLPILLILGLVLLQIVPLPPWVVAVLSPHTFADKRQAAALISAAGHFSAFGTPWMTVAYYRHPVVWQWMKLAAAAGLFFLVLNTVRSRARMEILLGVFIGVGLVQAVVAVFQFLGGAAPAGIGRNGSGSALPVTGAWVDAPALYGNLILTLCLLLGIVLARGRPETSPSPIDRVEKFAPESWKSGTVFVVFTAMVVWGGLILSGSAAVFTAIGAGLATLAGLLTAKKRLRKTGAMTAAAACVLLLYGIGQPDFLSVERSAVADPSAVSGARTAVRQKGPFPKGLMDMVLDYPVFGVGMGNAGYLYPRYAKGNWGARPDTTRSSGWLFAGAEAGLPAGVLILLGLGAYMAGIVPVWRSRKNAHALGVGAGAVAGVVAIGVYNLQTSPFHSHANLMVLAVFMAVGFTAVHRQGSGFRERVFYRMRKIGLNRGRRIVLGGMGLFLLTGLLMTVGRHALAEMQCPPAHAALGISRAGCAPHRLRAAIGWDPDNAGYHFRLAETVWEKGTRFRTEKTGGEKTGKQGVSHMAPGIENGLKAVALNPACGKCWLLLGLLFSRQREDPFDYLNRYLPLADRCLDMAVQCAPHEENVLFDTGTYWVRRSSLLPEDCAPAKINGSGPVRCRAEGIGKFQEFFKRGLVLNPERWREAAEQVRAVYADDNIVLGIVPPENRALQRQVMQWLAKQ